MEDSQTRETRAVAEASNLRGINLITTYEGDYRLTLTVYHCTTTTESLWWAVTIYIIYVIFLLRNGVYRSRIKNYSIVYFYLRKKNPWPILPVHSIPEQKHDTVLYKASGLELF